MNAINSAVDTFRTAEPFCPGNSFLSFYDPNSTTYRFYTLIAARFPYCIHANKHK